MGIFGQVGGPGNNYAVGGARTDYGGALGFLDLAIPTGIAEQVDFYLGRTSGVADPSALYFILVGGNDLRDAAGIVDAQQRDAAAIQAGENLAYSVRDLYLAGARRFVLIDSPDVGMIPEILSARLSAQGTDASVAFNSWMGLYADYLRSVPGFSLTYFDLFGLHHELINQYGLGSVRACKGDLRASAQKLFSLQRASDFLGPSNYRRPDCRPNFGILSFRYSLCHGLCRPNTRAIDGNSSPECGEHSVCRTLRDCQRCYRFGPPGSVTIASVNLGLERGVMQRRAYRGSCGMFKDAVRGFWPR
jgi:hypothetical protein